MKVTRLALPLDSSFCSCCANDSTQCDVAEIPLAGITCELAWTLAQSNEGHTTCPANLLAFCPVTCGNCAEDLYIDLLVNSASDAKASVEGDDFVGSLSLPAGVSILEITIGSDSEPTMAPTKEPTMEPTKAPTKEPTTAPDQCSRKDCNDHGTTSGIRPSCATCTCDKGYMGDKCQTQLIIKQQVKVSGPGYTKEYVQQNEDKFTELYANAINKPKENVRIAKVEEVTVRLLRRRLAVQVAIDYEVTVDTEEEKTQTEATLEDIATVESSLETEATSLGLTDLVVEQVSVVFEPCTRSADCNGN